MSVVQEAIAAVREALRLADEVKRTGATLKDLAAELRDHEKRIIRLETRWETAMDFARVNASGGPPRLPKDEGG